jgi:hypothetical protein
MVTVKDYSTNGDSWERTPLLHKGWKKRARCTRHKTMRVPLLIAKHKK